METHRSQDGRCRELYVAISSACSCAGISVDALVEEQELGDAAWLQVSIVRDATSQLTRHPNCFGPQMPHYGEVGNVRYDFSRSQILRSRHGRPQVITSGNKRPVAITAQERASTRSYHTWELDRLEYGFPEEFRQATGA